MNNALKQVFNKIDKHLIEEVVRIEYKLIREYTKLSSKDAIEYLAKKTYKSWDGQEYRLTESNIQHILYASNPGETNGQQS